MHRHELDASDDEPRHRPGVVQVVVEAGDRQLGEVRAGVGMIPRELGAVVRGAERAEQGRRPRMMQVRIVEHRQAGIPEEVGPLVVVVRRVADLVDGQVVGSPLVPPHEVVRRARARRHARDRLVHEDVDLDARRASAATRSALHAATPVATGGMGLNQARRGIWAF